jgi:hypothetical protein
LFVIQAQHKVQAFVKNISKQAVCEENAQEFSMVLEEQGVEEAKQ